MRRENDPFGYLAVPLNIICSSMWESPARPITSLRDPTLYHTWTVATGAFGTSTSSTFMPFERRYSWGSEAAAGCTDNSTSAVAGSSQDAMCRKRKLIMFGGEERDSAC